MENLEKFLKNLDEESAQNLDNYMYSLIYSWCQYCINNNTGDVEKSKDILRIIKPILKKTLCTFDKNGYKSIILACKLLINMNNSINFKPLKPETKLKHTEFINSFQVFMKDDDQKEKPSFYIYYEPYKYSESKIGTFYSLKDQFNIKQEYSIIGMSKELNMYRQETQKYFEDIFNDNNGIVEKIIFSQEKVSGKKLKLFYDNQIGIVWEDKNNDCVNCIQTLFKDGKFSKECEKQVIEDECYSEIRNRPENLQKKIEDILYNEKSEIKSSSKKLSPVFKNVYKELKKNKHLLWECQTCLTQNNNDVDNCIACTEKKQ
jgi:hypothetical protein